MKISTCTILIGIAALGSPKVSAAATAPEIRLWRVPEGGVQPEALVDAAGTVHLVYLKGDSKASDVMYVRKPAGAAEFTRPLRVNSKPGSAIAIGTVRGAQLALGRNGRVHVAWNGSDQAAATPGAGAPMLYARLNDVGTSFEDQRNLMTRTTHLDGGGSVAADGDGHVYVVWHAHSKTGPQEEIDRAVFLCFSGDDGRSFAPERQVNPADTGVCGCCGLKTFTDRQATLAILYRSANLAGNRDSILLLSTNLGTSFTATVLGQWHVSTCPMSTPFLSQSADGMLGAWETSGQIFFASGLENKAASGSARPAEGSTGDRKHPTTASSGRKRSPTLLAWTEGTAWEKGGALAWECLDDSGAKLGGGRVDGVPVWSFAAAVALPDGAFALIY